MTRLEEERDIMAGNLVDELNAEWRALAEAQHPLTVEWAYASEFAGCQSLEDVLRAVAENPDPTLGVLLIAAQDGDRLAGRTVLQAMTAKLVTMSREALCAGRVDALNDLVAQMWLQIATYPLDRRPTRIAANLALDTRKAALREWRQLDRELPMEVDTVVLGLARNIENESLTVNDVLDVAMEMGLLTRGTRDVLMAVYGPEGLSGASAAARWGCTPAAIRTRCKEARRRLAANAGAIAAAA